MRPRQRKAAFRKILFDQFYDTIKKDEDTLELQQARINETPNRAFVGIASDGAVNQTRRLLGSMSEREGQGPVAA